jgi:hypothetical protein
VPKISETQVKSQPDMKLPVQTREYRLLHLRWRIRRWQQISEQQTEPGKRRALRPIHVVQPEQSGRKQGECNQHREEA